MTANLAELVERARTIRMTPQQEREQRQSFVYGNTQIENNRITKEMVEAIDRKETNEKKQG